MAAFGYFPSIHDDAAENKSVWAPLYSVPKRPNRPTAGSGEDRRRAAAAAGDERLAASATSGRPEGPPEAPGGTAAAGPGSAPPMSEAEEICELCISLKEIELRNMMEETPEPPRRKTQRVIGCQWTVDRKTKRKLAKNSYFRK